jgi:hypothetical protein
MFQTHHTNTCVWILIKNNKFSLKILVLTKRIVLSYLIKRNILLRVCSCEVEVCLLTCGCAVCLEVLTSSTKKNLFSSTLFSESFFSLAQYLWVKLKKYLTVLVLLHITGNTKGGSITVPLTSCLTGLESAVWQLTIFVFICKTD